MLTCQANGVDDFVLQKRDAPNLYRSLRKGLANPVQHWQIADGKIVGSHTEPEPPTD